jgi:iron complex outermembrane receptor protein
MRPLILGAAILLFCFGPSVFSAFAQTGDEPENGVGAAAETGDQAYELPEVEVTGEYAAVQSPSTPVAAPYGPHNVVTEDQIKEQGSLDLLDTLRDVPGVFFSKRNIIGANTAASLYVRGRGYTHPSLDTVTSFDGVPRNGLIYGQSMADSFPVFAAAGVEVYKSPQPSNFGAGYALVNVEPKYMDEQGMEFEAGLSGGSFLTWAENAAFGWRKGRFDIYGAQSWVSSEGHIDHSGAYQQSYYLNMGFWINAYWNVRILGNYVDAETLQPPRKTANQRIALQTFKTDTVFTTATLNNEFDHLSGYLKIYFNNTDFSILDETGIPDEWSRQELMISGTKARETFSFWKGNEIISGFDFDWSRTSNKMYRVNRQVDTEFPDMSLFAPYAAVSQVIGKQEKFHLIPSTGLRGYLHSVWGNKAAPQAGAILGYNNTDLNFNYSFGVIYPAPAIIQSLINSKPDYDQEDLKKARPEIVYHYEAGVSHAWPDLVRINLSWFYDDGWDRIITGMSSGGIPGNASGFSYFKINGIEVSSSFSLEKNWRFMDSLSFFTGATWMKVSAKGEDGKEANRMPYTPDFSISGGFRWVFLEQFHLAGDYQHLGGLYAGGLMPEGNFIEPPEMSKLDDINLLNLRLGFGFDYKRWHIESAELFVSINNLLNKKYAYYTDYEMPGISFMIGGSFTLK